MTARQVRRRGYWHRESTISVKCKKAALDFNFTCVCVMFLHVGHTVLCKQWNNLTALIFSWFYYGISSCEWRASSSQHLHCLYCLSTFRLLFLLLAGPLSLFHLAGSNSFTRASNRHCDRLHFHLKGGPARTNSSVFTPVRPVAAQWCLCLCVPTSLVPESIFRMG